jgi:hypothetical protein
LFKLTSKNQLRKTSRILRQANQFNPTSPLQLTLISSWGIISIVSQNKKKTNNLAMLSSRVIARAGLRASSNLQVSRSIAVGGLRTYAAATAQEVRPPVALYGVDGTYANALVCRLSHHPRRFGYRRVV